MLCLVSSLHTRNRRIFIRYCHSSYPLKMNGGVLGMDIKTALDRFAPFGAGIGAVLTWYLMFFGYYVFSILLLLGPSVGGLLAFIIACILPPYLLCTCTHRKYVVFCPAGILAVIGTHVGFHIGTLIAYPFGVGHSGGRWVASVVLVPMFLFAFLFARFGCRWSEKRERKKKFEAIRKQVLMHQETLRTKYGVQHLEMSAPWVKELSDEMRVDVYVTFTAPVDVLQFEELRKEIEAITGMKVHLYSSIGGQR